ncbi:MAG: sulfotransferase domain-containing protein [SAR324 cluster bacterium]|nr:sulfotransferase domain-containing protein [SAR324 cluster bacterium]
MIPNLLISLVTGILLVEVAMVTFGGRWFLAQGKIISTKMNLFFAAKTDDERQVLVIDAGLTTLRFSLVSFLYVATLAAIAGFLPWFLAWEEEQNVDYAIYVSVIATLWWLVRYIFKKKKPETVDVNYNVIEKWLHWLALGSESVRRLSFDIERNYSLPPKKNSSGDNAVYVCGLARSGTTILLRLLDQQKVFKSLSYRDMPFVLAPNLWNRVINKSSKEAVLTERAHGDGIAVDFDSPEAFEEVFWKTFCGEETDGKYFKIKPATKQILKDFADYRAVVANSKFTLSENGERQFRYLSKNNNNIGRLKSLCEEKTTTILLVYRNPVDCALSLFRQHQRFIESEVEDSFTKAYMGWLSHHEFGPGHLPFDFAAKDMNPALSTEDPNYWLDYWIAVHIYLLEKHDLDQIHLVNHDVMKSLPREVIGAITSTLGVEADVEHLAGQISAPSKSKTPNGDFDEVLIAKANKIYEDFSKSPRNIFKPN